MARRRRSRIKPSGAQKRRLAAHLAWVVVLLQATMLVTLWVSKPLPRPPRVQWFELLWAWMHEPHFYPLAALIGAGIPLSIIVLAIRGSHRLVLAATWAFFALVIVLYYPQRFMLMLRTLYWAATHS